MSVVRAPGVTFRNRPWSVVITKAWGVVATVRTGYRLPTTRSTSCLTPLQLREAAKVELFGADAVVNFHPSVRLICVSVCFPRRPRPRLQNGALHNSQFEQAVPVSF